MSFLLTGPHSVPTFLRDKVLSSPKMRKQLETWLTVTTSIERMSRTLHISPTIWLLTGFIELDNAKCSTTSTRGGSAGLSVPSELIMTATGAPLGGGLSGNRSTSTKVARENPGTLIWAARFEKLAVHYSKDNTRFDDSLIQVRKLPVLSQGDIRGGNNEHSNAKEEAEYLHLALDDGQDPSGIPRSAGDNASQEHRDDNEHDLDGNSTQDETDGGALSKEEQWWDYFDMAAQLKSPAVVSSTSPDRIRYSRHPMKRENTSSDYTDLNTLNIPGPFPIEEMPESSSSNRYT